MNKTLLAAIACIGTIGFSQGAFAAVETFESISVGSYASITSGGITYSLSSGNITISNDDNGVFVNAPSGTHFLDNRYGGADFIFSLAAPVGSFGLQIGATNSAQTLSAYDSGNNLLGSVAIPNQVSSLPYPYTGFYTLNYSGISKVVLTGSNSDWIAVDNVTAAVPEPESYAMLLAGLGIMGAVARRRRGA